MHLKVIIYFLLLITITVHSLSDWEQFKNDYNKQYASPEEEAQREQIFLKNLKQINKYQTMNPHATFNIGINHLSDQHIDELISDSKLFSKIRSSKIEEPIQAKIIIPTFLNWRFRNVTTSVYNQSIGIRSPAIAAVEVLESYYAIQKNELIRGSVVEVSACCGNALDVFDCILSKLNGGICAENTYIASNTTCNRTACEPFVVFNNIKKIDSAKETTMLEWIQDSPLYVAIDASQITFQTYRTGIYTDTNCSRTIVNHALQLVGYGFQSGIPYWLCKNSWGEEWGEEGYIRIERGRNTCGIATSVVQIEYNSPNNNAIRLLIFDSLYLVFFCLFVHIFMNLK